ncbi:MAG: hypothetical protein ACOYXU_11595 [Nitrospirota bacterium]
MTGVGTPPAPAVVAAFKRRGWLVVGVDAEFHPRQVNQFYLVSRGDQPGFVDELLMLVRRERTTLVVPTRDVDALAVARSVHEFRRLGAGVYLPDYGTIETLSGGDGALSVVRRLGIDAYDPPGFPAPPMPGVQWFEVSACRDARLPLSAVACAVHELWADAGGSSVTAERRKGEADVEEFAARAIHALGIPGPSTVLVRRAPDGRLGVERVSLRPCEYAPFTDDMLDAFLSLWERDQPQ